MVAAYRMQQGAALIKTNPMFAREDKQYGVPAPVIIAFWGLESDFGADRARTMRSAPGLAGLRLPPQRKIPRAICSTRCA